MRALVGLLGAAMLLVGCTSGQSAPGAGTAVPEVPLQAPSVGPAMPAHGAFFGAWVAPDGLATQPAQAASVADFEQRIGRPLAFVHVFRRFDDPFPRPLDLQYLRDGRDLLLSWNSIDTRVIASGQEDAQIRTMASAVKSLGYPIWLRFRWEMNRRNLQAMVWSPEDYVAAWKHVRSVFAEEDATNAAWVWCPLAAGFDETDAAAYYPGDDQVDWLCADVYPDQDRSFADVIAPFMAWAKGHPQPVMIGEFGVSDRQQVDRATWLSDAFDYVESQPRIKALAYFEGYSDALPDDPAVRENFKLAAGSAELAAVREAVNRPYFAVMPHGAAGPASGSPSP